VCKNKKAHKHSHHGHTGNTRHSPRNGFNGFLRALPGDRACLPPSSAKVASRQLDASVGASGPHDFAVRWSAPSSEAPPASTASRPAFVTIASRPSKGTGPNRYNAASTGPSSEISENQKWRSAIFVRVRASSWPGLAVRRTASLPLAYARPSIRFGKSFLEV